MDINILVEYADVKEELKDLRRRIEKDRRELKKLEQMTVADVVTKGKKGKKLLGTAKIEGKPHKRIERKKSAIKRNVKLMEIYETELLEKQTQAEEYIESIEKSELRIMFRLYYIDDLPWYKVAMNMNEIFPKRKIKYTEDSCRMRHSRFLEKF